MPSYASAAAGAPVAPFRSDATMQVNPITLRGRHVLLEPLEPRHADALLTVAVDPRIWEFTSAPIRNRAEVHMYVDTALEWQRAGTAVPFATLESGSAAVIGSTRFENIDVANRGVEIGWSWLNPRWWRTPINTETKYLMLRHAFEEWKCIRVEFKTWVQNQRSRSAILRIGAKEEAIMRQRMIGHDGSFRDAVYFSILDDEWPEVKRCLEKRLSQSSIV